MSTIDYVGHTLTIIGIVFGAVRLAKWVFGGQSTLDQFNGEQRESEEVIHLEPGIVIQTLEELPQTPPPNFDGDPARSADPQIIYQ